MADWPRRSLKAEAKGKVEVEAGPEQTTELQAGCLLFARQRQPVEESLDLRSTFAQQQCDRTVDSRIHVVHLGCLKPRSQPRRGRIPAHNEYPVWSHSFVQDRLVALQAAMVR